MGKIIRSKVRVMIKDAENQPIWKSIPDSVNVKSTSVAIGCCENKELDQKCNTCYWDHILKRNFLKRTSHEMRRLNGMTLSEYGKSKRQTERIDRHV